LPSANCDVAGLAAAQIARREFGIPIICSLLQNRGA
jgi:hypothetical protein